MAAVGKSWARLAAFLGMMALGIVLVRLTPLGTLLQGGQPREHALTTLRSVAAVWWVGPGYALAYAAAIALAVPGLPLTLLGGAAFGLLRGVLWVTIGANLGANVAFLLARRLGRTSLQELLGSRLASFDRVSVAAGFHGLLALRLLPVVPFNLLNYASGLTPIPWRDYALATGIGILPGTVVYVFFADALLQGSVAARAEARWQALLAAAVLIAFSLITRWFLKRRQKSSRSSSPR